MKGLNPIFKLSLTIIMVVLNGDLSMVQCLTIISLNTGLTMGLNAVQFMITSLIMNQNVVQYLSTWTKSLIMNLNLVVGLIISLYMNQKSSLCVAQ